MLKDENEGDYLNQVEGTVDQIIFEGSTAQLHVNAGGQMLRVDVSGVDRLQLLDRRGQIHLGFNEVTLIPDIQTEQQ